MVQSSQYIGFQAGAAGVLTPWGTLLAHRQLRTLAGTTPIPTYVIGNWWDPN